MTPGVTGVYHDDAVYVASAQSIADGAGYRVDGVPGSPAQTKYPLLYPLGLAAVWTLWPDFPANVGAMQVLTLIAGAAGMAGSYLFLVRFGYCGRLAAAGVGLVCATSPDVIFFSTITMSEMPFLLCTVAALWRLESAVATGHTGSRALLTGIVMTLPFHCRSIGAVILVAAVALLVRQGRPVLTIAAGAALTLVPWLWWSAAAWGQFGDDAILGYYTDYPGAWAAVTSGGLGKVVSLNSGLLLAATGMMAGPGAWRLASVLAWPSAMVTPTLLAAGLVVWSALWWSRAPLRLLHWTLLTYALVVLCWPWPPQRFVVPVAPLLLGAAAGGLPRVRRLARRWSTAGGLAVAASLVAANLVVVSRWQQVAAAREYPVYSNETPPAWSSFEDLFVWVRANTQTSDRLAAGLDSMLALYTGREVMRPFPHRPDALFYGSGAAPVGTIDDLSETLARHQVRYLAATPMYLFAEEAPLDSLVTVAATTFGWPMVYQGTDQRFRVYRVDGDRRR